MARLLSEYGEIRNEGRCISELKSQIKEFAKLSDANIISKLSESAKKTNRIRYFNFDYLELSEDECGKDVMWVDTGYTNMFGSAVYVQFTGGSPWSGALVGTESSILDYQTSYREAKKGTTKEKLEQELDVDLSKLEGVSITLASDEIKQPVQKINKNESFLNILYERLLIPHSWTVESLDNYTNLCIARINNCLLNGKDCSDYVIFNKDMTLALINSGLLDKFGKYIMLITKIYGGLANEGKTIELGYTGLRLGGSKASLCEEGFRKEDLNRNIERVQFSDNGLTDLVFTSGLDDFDLDSRSRLEHCITDRRLRFPESYADANKEVICSDIIKAIELAVVLNKYDRNYIKPIYNRTRDSIDFVIPYHVGNDFQKKPELGIVIAYFNDYWQIMTVLNYEDVIKDIKLFNMYENETF